ncbi:MAG TPA: DUF4350 domain-containing protein [Polyangiaceae bacterium]|jgi:hypothetical protein
MRRLVRLSAGAVLAGALAWSAPSAAGAFEFNDPSWEGTSELLSLARERLGAHRVKLIATIDWGEVTPADALLVVHPTRVIEYAEASAFLRAGGRIAVLDDFGSGATLLERFQIHRIRAPGRPVESLRENPRLAVAVPAVQQVAGHEQGRHPVVAQVDQVVTNHPSALSHPNLTPVLKIPARGEPDATLAVTGIITERGRLFAMADPSAVINLMLRYPGNRAFATGLVDYLVEDDRWGKRGGSLYLVANDLRQRGSFGGADDLSSQLASEIDALGDMVNELHTRGLPPVAAELLGVVAGLLSLGWVAWVATRPYRRIEPRFARALPVVAQGGLAGRAAALAAGTTHRALAVIEVKSALGEALADHLGLPPNSAPDELVRALGERNVSPARLAELKALLIELREVENSVAAAQPVRVSVAQVRLLWKRAARLLEAISEEQKPGPQRKSTS